MPRPKQPSARRHAETSLFSRYDLWPFGRRRAYFRFLGEAYAYAGNAFLMREAFREIGEEPSPAAQQLYAAAVPRHASASHAGAKRFLHLRARCAAAGRSVPVSAAVEIYRSHLSGAGDVEDLLAVSSYLGVPLDAHSLEELLYDEAIRGPDTLSFECSFLARRVPHYLPEWGRWALDETKVFETDWLATVTIRDTTPEGVTTERRIRGGVPIFNRDVRPIVLDAPTIAFRRDSPDGPLEAVLRNEREDLTLRREDLLAVVPAHYNLEKRQALSANDVGDLRVFFGRRCKRLYQLERARAAASTSA